MLFLSRIPFLLILSAVVFGRLVAQNPALDSDFRLMLDVLLTGDVETLSASDLQGMNTAVCLDAREWEEYTVSHIDGARWIGYEDFQPQRLQGLSPGDTLVIYCSVGYRSEKIARELNKQGYTKVYNLYGGIFGWVNQGYPVMNESGATQDVHAYNRIWSRWLKRGNAKF